MAGFPRAMDHETMNTALKTIRPFPALSVPFWSLLEKSSFSNFRHKAKNNWGLASSMTVIAITSGPNQLSFGVMAYIDL